MRGVALPLVLGVDVPLFAAALAARSAFRFCFARLLILDGGGSGGGE